jgi:hypothetical protein
MEGKVDRIRSCVSWLAPTPTPPPIPPVEKRQRNGPHSPCGRKVRPLSSPRSGKKDSRGSLAVISGGHRAEGSREGVMGEGRDGGLTSAKGQSSQRRPKREGGGVA